MPKAPPLAPSEEHYGTVYLVLDDFDLLGRAYRETDEATADARSVVRDLIQGQYNKPVRVVAFNTEEGWARDVSTEIARSVVEVTETQDRRLGRSTIAFVERHLGAEMLQVAPES